MKTITVIASLFFLSITSWMAWAQDESIKAPEPKPRIQIALLLDTSNSMDGLIDQAKTRLWKIVNELILAERNGQKPEFEVALYEYGNNSIPEGEGYIRLVNPLTTDLDKVSEDLFALRTNGGHEFCGKVIDAAIKGLQWSFNPNDLKTIYIAGNEPFTQGDVDYKAACRAAIKKGVLVNTIFCGDYNEGINTQWKDGAVIAEGSYINIDQNQAYVHIDAPQDVDILRLNDELNATYIAYGDAGLAGRSRQSAQDSNMGSISAGVKAERAVTKSSSYYNNASWDLVDAYKDKKVDLSNIEAGKLPENMQAMTPGERVDYVNEQSGKRAEIQAKIRQLSAERDKFVQEELSKRADTGTDTFDSAMIKSLRSQAEARGFDIKK